MFGDFRIADFIAIHCMYIDIQCREELRNGVIVSERDYVSTLSTRIRDRIGLEFSCYAQTLRQGIETENGVDGLIMFKFINEIKIGWYEAKWPRVTEADYRWDRVPTGHDMSHFSEQILKQNRWSGTLALWEMFFNDGTDGFESPPYQNFGSSCVWHENAFDFMLREGIFFNRWTTEDLKQMLQLNCINFYTVIYEMLCCKRGKKIKVAPGQKSVRLEIPKGKEGYFEIPLPGNVSAEYDDAINEFMKERNIAGYLFMDLNEIRKPK